MSFDDYSAAVTAAINGMQAIGPRAIVAEVNRNLEDDDIEITEGDLVELLTTPGEAQATTFMLTVLGWDRAGADAKWANATEPQTPERRARIHERLALAAESQAILDQVYPVDINAGIKIATGDWNVWYDDARQSAHSFYWDHYRGVLTGGDFGVDAIAKIDEMTDEIVGRLADPTAIQPYQSKGLVVGYVQSGKTANFTGVIAKAMDAGYRLVIVLTGTYDILRVQTQRRLDKELVGRENIIGGRTPDDPTIDYVKSGDQGWKSGEFHELGIQPARANGIPGIRRLTTSTSDYQLLAAGISALDFSYEKTDKQKPVWDPSNIYNSDVRLVVIKKNSTVLKKLNKDLAAINADLTEIPTIILDDEADLASVNTIRPGKLNAQGEQERTAVNKELAILLKTIPRAQYVGYTATPVANVFVDPNVEEDIFPRDFMFSLEPGSEYMGGAAFHDIGGVPIGSEGDPAASNQAAFVRDLGADASVSEDDEIGAALDAYVLTGGIKLWRKSRGEGRDGHPYKYKHHTMLVHESTSRAEHALLAGRIETIWKMRGYLTAAGKQRLKRLWEDDFNEVWKSRPFDEWRATMPGDFAELVPFIGEAVGKMTDGKGPVVVVNGDKNSDYEALDFQAKETWRVLVGGAKLSRGFTVEDLTISYYRRRAQTADTLMQMGRWFGYRPGYRDLVRLYIDRNAVDGRGRSFDLYEAFEASLRDERDLRNQLAQYSGKNEDGTPKITPQDVPPLIFQTLPWLRPAASNKMYNAVLRMLGQGGVPQSFEWYFPRAADPNPARWALVKPWLEQLGTEEDFTSAGILQGFKARTAIVPAQSVSDALASLELPDGYTLAPELRFMEQVIGEHRLEEFVVIVPVFGQSVERTVDGIALPMNHLRIRRDDRQAFAGKSFDRHESAFQHISGHPAVTDGGPNAAKLIGDGRRGVLALYFTYDPHSLTGLDQKAARDALKAMAVPNPVSIGDTAVFFNLTFPYASAPAGRVAFGHVVPALASAPIVNNPDPAKP
jgi:hypothetical protein